MLARGNPDAGETLYRRLIEQLPAVLYIDSNDASPELIYVSPQIEQMFGWPAELWMSDRRLWKDSIHPDDFEYVNRSWLESLRTQLPFVVEYRVLRPDGTYVWTHDSCIPVRDVDGRTSWHGVMQDITAAKDIERSLRDSEAKYRALVENVPAVVYAVAPDDDRKTLYVSPEVETALGYSREEWLEQPDIWMELLHPDDREQTLAAHDLANETGKPWSREYRLIASDGRGVWFRDVATLVRDADGRPLHWVGVQFDIAELKHVEDELRDARDELELRVLVRTHELEEANELMMLEIEERRRVERELRDARERYRLLVENLPGATFVWDVNATSDEPVYVSPQIESILGYTAEEWGRADFWRSRIHPDDRRAVLRATLHSSVTGQPFSMEYRYLAKDGRIVWVLEEATLQERDERGRPRIFHGLMLDITDRKRAEAKRNEAERRLRALIEQIPAIVYIELPARPAGESQLLFINPQVDAILGYTTDELMDDPAHLSAVLHPEDRERILAADAESGATGRPFDEEYRMIAKDGRTIWLHSRATLVADDDGHPLYWQGVAFDVTDSHELTAVRERDDAERRKRTSGGTLETA